MNQLAKFSVNGLSPTSISIAIHLGILIILSSPFFKRSETLESVDFDVTEVFKQALSPMQIKSKPIERPKQRAVFGLSKNSLTGDDQGQAKTGNTVAKTPDNEILSPQDASSLPIPSDEYLVSQMPVLVSDIRVAYPEESKKRGIQGAVLFDLLIDSEGRVRESKLLEGPDMSLKEAAQSVVEQLKFKPALIEGKPVAVRIRYAYRFVLEK